MADNGDTKETKKSSSRADKKSLAPDGGSMNIVALKEKPIA
jgi:hypothetical protein